MRPAGLGENRLNAQEKPSADQQRKQREGWKYRTRGVPRVEKADSPYGEESDGGAASPRPEKGHEDAADHRLDESRQRKRIAPFICLELKHGAD